MYLQTADLIPAMSASWKNLRMRAAKPLTTGPAPTGPVTTDITTTADPMTGIMTGPVTAGIPTIMTMTGIRPGRGDIKENTIFGFPFWQIRGKIEIGPTIAGPKES